MPELKTSRHLDDFTLLRHRAGDLDDFERRRTERHLTGCRLCASALLSIGRLDEELKAMAAEDAAADSLPAGDPFARRPEAPERREARTPERSRHLAGLALLTSERAGARSGEILAAARGSSGNLASLLSDLVLSDPSDRFALLYALQEAGREIAENPGRAMAFAEESRDRVRREPARDAAAEEAERVLPLAALEGQAHLLAGEAANWTGELDKAKLYFEQAYRAIGESTGDEAALATVEHHEAQRRSFAGKPAEGAHLARRAAATFREMGLEDKEACARVALGIALYKLGRPEEALESFQSTLPVFGAHKLRSNYVGAVNAVGTCLMKLGRLDDARREYARALRAVSRERDAAWMPYIRNGLAHLLFTAGSFRDAALAFSQTARLFRELGLVGHTLTASLYEIESWALSGDGARASHRLEIFRADVSRHNALDPSIVQRLEVALSGQNPDFEELARLREFAGQVFDARLEETSG